MCKKEIIDKLINWELLKKNSGVWALSNEQGIIKLNF